jgi:hypothetical protein
MSNFNNSNNNKLLQSPGILRPTTPGSKLPIPPLRPKVPPTITPPALLNDPPWVLLAKAAGVYEPQFAAGGVSDMPPVTFQKPPKYEQGYWAFCPIVGSASMLLEGRTAFHKVAGGVFLVMDLTLVGPVMRGVLIGTKAAASAGLRMVMNRGGGTLLQQQAMAQFIKTGGTLLTREAAEAMIQAKLRSGNVLIVGAETSANAVNHVVAYMVEQGTGTVWRLHGGITQLAHIPGKYVGREALTKTVGQLNTMSMYHLAHSPAEVAAWWAKFAGSNSVTAFMRGGAPKGCAGSAVLILEHLSQQGAIQGVPAITGAARWMPLYLDRALGGYVLNPVNVLKGTMAHGAAAAILPLAFRTPMLPLVAGTLPRQGYNFEWTDMIPGGNPFGMVSDFYSDSPGMSVASVLGIPDANFSLDIRQAATSFPAGGIRLNLPPPYVKLDSPPEPPPVTQLDTIKGTWTTTANGVQLRMTADNYGQPPGVWLIKMFSGNGADSFYTFQVKMRGSEGKYINYPIAQQEILKFHLINPNTLHQLDGPSGQEQIKRTWRR